MKLEDITIENVQKTIMRWRETNGTTPTPILLAIRYCDFIKRANDQVLNGEDFKNSMTFEEYLLLHIFHDSGLTIYKHRNSGEWKLELGIVYDGRYIDILDTSAQMPFTMGEEIDVMKSYFNYEYFPAVLPLKLNVCMNVQSKTNVVSIVLPMNEILFNTDFISSTIQMYTAPKFIDSHPAIAVREFLFRMLKIV